MIPFTRITEPGSNHHLTISDVIARLDAIRQQHGDLPCYIYSSDRKASVPLLALSIYQDARGRLHFSPQTGSVCDEVYEDLRNEIKRLHLAMEVNS